MSIHEQADSSAVEIQESVSILYAIRSIIDLGGRHGVYVDLAQVADADQ